MFRRQDTKATERQGSKRSEFFKWVCFFAMYYVLCTTHCIFAQDFSLGEIVVTAKKGYERSILSIPASITVIDSAAIQKSNAKNVPELLKSEAGVVVRDLYGNGSQATVDIRGFGDASGRNSAILIDGRRINNIDMANPDLTQISLSGIDRIEVLRGGSSILYGDDAVGGVINIITKKPQGKNVNLGISFDGFGGNNINAAIENNLEKISYSFNAGYKFDQGYRNHNEMNASDISAAMNSKEAQGVPGWEILAGLHSDKYQLPGYISQADWDSGDYWRANNSTDYGQSVDWYSRIAIDKTIEAVKTRTELSVRNRNARSFMDSWFSFNSRSTRIFGASENLSWDLLGVDLLSGAEYYSTNYLISPENRTGDPTAGLDDQRLMRQSTAGYIQLSAPLFNIFSLEGGARVEGINQHFIVEASASDTFKNEVLNAYYMGLGVKILEDANVYAKWSQSFRMPKTDEYYCYGVYNALLKSQKSEDVEFGFKYRKEKISGEIAFFLMNVYDEIYYHSYGLFDPRNKNENYPNTTIRRGIEAGLKVQPLDFFAISLNYALTEAKIDTGTGVYAGKYIPLVPMHKGNIKMAFVLPLAINLTADCIMVSDRWYSSDYTQDDAKLAGYTTVDLNFWKQFENLRLFGAITNIGDTKYAETAYKGGYYYPSPGRNFSVGAQVSL